MNSIYDIVKNDYCSGCGTCAVVCPHSAITITYNIKKGLLLPNIQKKLCTNCGKCLLTCPGLVYDYFPQQREKFFISENLCNAEKGYIAHSTDNFIREHGASGGMITQILCFMLERKIIDGAVVSAIEKNFPGYAVSKISKNPSELIASQGSLYCPSATNLILKEILLDKNGSQFAFVGLPCQILALRIMQERYPILQKKIPFVFGLFCSRTPRGHATFDLLKKLNVDITHKYTLKYRGYGHPGCLSITDEYNVKKIHHLHKDYWGHYFLRFYKPWRCWVCPDHSAELADISFADSWSRSDSMGENVVIIRNQYFENLLYHMNKNKFIDYTPTTVSTIITEQNLLDKCNTKPRFFILNLFGKKYCGKRVPTRGQQTFLSKIKQLPEFFRILVSSRRYIWKKFFIEGDYLLMKITLHIKKYVKKIFKIIKIFKILPPNNNKHTYNIVIVGGYGWLDIGDEAMPKADILKFRTIIKNIKILMLSPCPNQTEKYHLEKSDFDLKNMNWGEGVFRYRVKNFVCFLLFLFGALAQRFGIRFQLWENARSILDYIDTCDVFFNVGGGNLNSIMRGELYKKCAQYLACRILNKPIIVSGQSIGPLYNIVDKFILRLSLNQVSMITFRDKNNSIELVKSLGIHKPIMLDTADDAITLPALDYIDAQNLWNRTIGEKAKNFKIGLNLKGSMSIFKGKNRINSMDNEIIFMANLADKLISEFDADLIFIPTDFSDGVDDRYLHREIVQKMTSPQKAILLEDILTDREIKSIVANCDFIIGSRYHLCVFSASENIPFIGIASGVYQQQKLKGLANLCGLPQCFIQDDLEFISLDRVWEHIKSMILNRESIKEDLIKVNSQMKDASYASIRYATDFIIKKYNK